MDDSFIVEIKNALSPELCNEIIKKFEQDERKHPGTTGDTAMLSKLKNSTDLFISPFPEWDDINETLLKNFYYNFKTIYSEKINKLSGAELWWKTHPSNKYSENQIGIQDLFNTITGFQIQRTEKGDGYDWHTDYSLADQRFLTYIYYLNTLDEEDGGCTEFVNGLKVRPEQGKLLIFPATWTCVHKGNPVLGKTKYIITGWFNNSNPYTEGLIYKDLD